MPGEAKPVQIDIHMREKVATRPDTKHSEEAHQPSSPLKAASSNLEQNYDAFLSFRGTDVRKNFLGHLYAALDQKGIYTYVDSEELQKGERITPALIKAIEDSRIAIIIFSEDYASSLWCLEEVEKIMECKEQRGLKVFPVFYKVDPREVRTPRESYRKAMDKHERKFGRDSEKVKRWKKALFDAGSLSGWDLKDKGKDRSQQLQKKRKGKVSKRKEKKESPHVTVHLLRGGVFPPAPLLAPSPSRPLPLPRLSCSRDAGPPFRTSTREPASIRSPPALPRSACNR